MANSSGMIAHADEQALTGLQLYIDTDTSPSATISGETMNFSAEFAKLLAGKGVKVPVNQVMKSFEASMSFKCHEISTKAISILYGGDISNITTPFTGTKLSIKGKFTQPVVKKYTFKGLTCEGKQIQIVFYRAKNAEYGNIAFDGSDFAAIPVKMVPIPAVPGDDTEVLVDIMVETAGT